MKLLIAVKSCQHDLDAGYHDAIRNTWGKDLKVLGVDVMFFLGQQPYNASVSHPKADEKYLDCPDDYMSLPYKTKRICEWATGKSARHIFLCDVDTFLRPTSLLATGFERWDYAGLIREPITEPFPYTAVGHGGVEEKYEKCYPWASGGYGYFLSRKAFSIVAENRPTSWAEDVWVGQLLAPYIQKGEIQATNLSDYRKTSLHFFKPGNGWLYKPEYMLEAYKGDLKRFR